MPQAYKGTLGAIAAARAVAEGVRRVLPDADTVLLPMADGGDDTLDVLVAATDGQVRRADVHGPLGTRVRAEWGVLGDGRTAVVEMARASGLRLLRPQERDPRRASTFGTGELIRAALDGGYRSLIVGVGGSATVDGGAGAVNALGVRLLEADGDPLPPGGAALAKLATIDAAALDPRIGEARIVVACDTDAPVCGVPGASQYSAQKGASPKTVEELERALETWCTVVERTVGVSLARMPWTGPAGGLAGGLHAFLRAALRPGAELVMETIGAERHLESADLVITGEGTLDATSFQRKGTGVIAERAAAAAVPVMAVVGETRLVDADRARLFAVIESMVDHAGSREAAMSRPAEVLTIATAAAVRRFLALGS